MDFNLTETQASWQSKAVAFASSLAASEAKEVVARAGQAALIQPDADLLAAAVVVDAVAWESAAAAITLALHTGVVMGLGDDARAGALVRGEMVGAIALSSEDLPSPQNGRLHGRASWVAPLADRGVAIVGVRAGSGVEAAAVELDSPGVTCEPVESAALSGLICGHMRFDGAEFTAMGATTPSMTRVRVLLAAAALGMGRRALHEALSVARGHTGRGAGGEQTVQGLLADSATELDAAKLLTWKAASSRAPSLADASMAKLAATDATQRAVARATQVVGGDSFRSGHIVERLAQDMRALELFAGRTEALREAVALETLPPG
jgi:alkylation response protein AidB-like acyl-CoA dehydrogenase